MELVDPDPANLVGQTVYLDFDGAEGVVYNGPVTVGPFDVPAFEAPGELAGQERLIIDCTVVRLQRTFAGSGVIFTTDQPGVDTEYSTIYIGGEGSSFARYGSFLGLAEQVDISNTERADNAFVFCGGDGRCSLLTLLCLQACGCDCPRGGPSVGLRA